MEQEVEEYLRSVYPEKRIQYEDEFQFEKNTKILELSFPLIEKHYPQLKLYKTHLKTAYFEFPEVEILIAVKDGNIKNIHLLKSLSFEPIKQDFLEIFNGGVCKSWNKQNELGKEITTLFSSVAVQPEIQEKSSQSAKTIRYRINQSNSSYIDLKFIFNNKGELINILFSGN